MSDREEIAQSFAIVVRLIADLRLEIEALRVVLRAHGVVTNEEFDEVRAALKQKWEPEAQAKTARMKAALADMDLLKALAEYEGPTQ